MRKTLTFFSFLVLAIACAKENNSKKTVQLLEKTESYSKTLSTDGNSYDTIVFPGFDTSKGILQSAILTLQIQTVYFTFNLENNEDSTFNYNIELGRKDFLGVNGAGLSRIDSITKNYFYNLAPSDGIPGSGADFIQVNNLPFVQQFSYADSSIIPILSNPPPTLTLIHLSSTFGYSVNGVLFTLRGMAKDAFTIGLQYQYQTKP